MSKEYLDSQNKSGLKVGDVVKIARPAFNGQNGWKNSWVGGYVNRLGVIKSIDGEFGIRVDIKDSNASYQFPFFCLDKLNQNEIVAQEKSDEQFKNLNVICEIGDDKEKSLLITKLVENHPRFSAYRCDLGYRPYNIFFYLLSNHRGTGRNYAAFTSSVGDSTFQDCRIILYEELLDILDYVPEKLPPLTVKSVIRLSLERLA